MANEQNLKGHGFDERSTEEVRAAARKGGINSGKTRRKKRSMKNAAKMLLNMPATKSLTKKLELFGIDEEDATYQMAIMVAMLQEATSGDVRAAAFLRDTAGEDTDTEMRKQEFKLRKDEFKHRVSVDSKADDTGSVSLADIIIDAYKANRSEDE